MSLNAITDPHKAVINRHLEEGLLDEVPLDQIHQELVEIFSGKGRYTLKQIAAVTSWLRSNILGKKRKNSVQWDENEGATREDVNFDNPDKNDSRAWHVRQLVKHTTEEQRRVMSLLLLPGKNTYDFDAFEETGIAAENMLTFILGDDPKSVAQYLRNCRRRGVRHRYVGDMEKYLPTETKRIQAAYLDEFGQLCPTYIQHLRLLPIDPDFPRFCLGFNIQKGREHEETQELMHQVSVLQSGKGSQWPKNSSMSQKMELLLAEANSETSEISEIRNDVVKAILTMSIGRNRFENWIMPEGLRTFLGQVGPNDDYDDIDDYEKMYRCDYALDRLTEIFQVITLNLPLGEPNLNVDLAQLAASISLAVRNTPIVRAIEDPKPYKSPQNNRPFVSYFAVLETKRKAYMRHSEAMTFLFNFGSYLYPRIMAAAESGNHSLSTGFIRCDGSGSARTITIRDDEGHIIASANRDSLLEAMFVFSESCLDPEDGSSSKKIASAKEQAILMAHNQDKAETQVFPPLFGSRSERIRRNDPCRCGSGKKFKKCCMKH